MGGATDFKVYPPLFQNRIRERSERKHFFVYTPTFQNVGVQASKYQ